MVTTTFVKFPNKQILYALSQMQLAHSKLSKVEGHQMYKLMGSGAGNGFSIWPDWNVFCLLIQWDQEESSQSFFHSNPFWQQYSKRASAFFTIKMNPTITKGTWDGGNPFLKSTGTYDQGKIAVLTRATIKKRYIPYFWSKVPQASRVVPNMPGHIYSKGVGELPLFLQATLSIWESKEQMYDYAYRHKDHIDMIKMTREKGWYSEEMFTEFNVIGIDGDIF